jgi:hypothetical protein
MEDEIWNGEGTLCRLQWYQNETKSSETWTLFSRPPPPPPPSWSIYPLSNTCECMGYTWHTRNSFRGQMSRHKISFLTTVESIIVRDSLASIYFVDSGTRLWPVSNSIPGSSPSCCVLGSWGKELVGISLRASFAAVVKNSCVFVVAKSSFPLARCPPLVFRENCCGRTRSLYQPGSFLRKQKQIFKYFIFKTSDKMYVCIFPAAFELKIAVAACTSPFNRTADTIPART